MEFNTEGLLTYSNIAMVVLLGFIWFSWRKFKKSQKDKDAKKFSMSGFFIDDPTHKFEIVATISTVCEVVGLALLAIDRGVEPFNAASRYLTIGFVELMFTFLFLNVTTGMIRNFMRRIYLDGKVRWYEYLTYPTLFFLMAIPLFMICCIPTYIISQLYFESIGVLKFNYVNNFWPWDYLEPADVSNTYIDENGIMITTYPELGALILIWFTPLLNVMQLPLAFLNIRAEEKKKANEEHEIDGNSATIDELLNQMDSMFAWCDKDDIMKRLTELTDKSNKDAYKAITSGKTTKDAYIEKFRKELLGSADDKKKLSGWLGYKFVHDELQNKVKGELDKHKLRQTKLDEDKRKLDKEIKDLEKDKPSGYQTQVDNKKDEISNIEKELLDITEKRDNLRTTRADLEGKLNDLKTKLKNKLEKTNLID